MKSIYLSITYFYFLFSFSSRSHIYLSRRHITYTSARHIASTRERASPCINLPSRNRNDASHPSSPPPPLTPFACKNIERNISESLGTDRSSRQFHHLVKWRNLISGLLPRMEHLRTYANQPGVRMRVCTCEVAADRTPISSLTRVTHRQRIVPRVFWQIATSLLPICLHATG